MHCSNAPKATVECVYVVPTPSSVVAGTSEVRRGPFVCGTAKYRRVPGSTKDQAIGGGFLDTCSTCGLSVHTVSAAVL